MFSHSVYYNEYLFATHIKWQYLPIISDELFFAKKNRNCIAALSHQVQVNWLFACHFLQTASYTIVYIHLKQFFD